MLPEDKTAVIDGAERAIGRSIAGSIQRAGRVVALAGVAAPLLLIGGLKFTPFEVEALKPLIGSTPWLAWLYPTFGAAGASYLLGVVEIASGSLSE